MFGIILGIGVVSGAVIKMLLKDGRIRAAFFLCRQTLLSYRTSESSVFSIQGGGVRGGSRGAPRGAPGGPRGGPRGGPGGPKTKFIKIYEDPKRPHNSGFWIGMTPRDDRDGRGGVPGVRKMNKKTMSKKSTSLVKISSSEIFTVDIFDCFGDRFLIKYRLLFFLNKS
jgi:hypothetical protein